MLELAIVLVDVDEVGIVDVDEVGIVDVDEVGIVAETDIYSLNKKFKI